MRFNYYAADLTVPSKDNITLITRFVKAKALMHQRLVPLVQSSVFPAAVLFSKRHVYRHDSVYMQNDPMFAPSPMTLSGFSMPFETIKYAGTNTEMFEKRTKLTSSYLTAAQGSANTDVSDESSEAQQMAAIENEFLASMKSDQEASKIPGKNVFPKGKVMPPVTETSAAGHAAAHPNGKRSTGKASPKPDHPKTNKGADPKVHPAGKKKELDKALKPDHFTKLDDELILKIADLEPGEAEAFLMKAGVPKSAVANYLKA